VILFIWQDSFPPASCKDWELPEVFTSSSSEVAGELSPTFNWN